jgi:hypothetical protein
VAQQLSIAQVGTDLLQQIAKELRLAHAESLAVDVSAELRLAWVRERVVRAGLVVQQALNAHLEASA